MLSKSIKNEKFEIRIEKRILKLLLLRNLLLIEILNEFRMLCDEIFLLRLRCFDNERFKKNTKFF